MTPMEWSKRGRAAGTRVGCSADYGAIPWILTLYAVGVFISRLRDLAAGRKLARAGELLPA
jgi:hypothetical protein